MPPLIRRYAAGAEVDDLCRVCKEVRHHRVIAVDGDGAILRVVCGYCGSQHNFRGGERDEPRREATSGVVPGRGARPDIVAVRGAFPPVTERERAYPAMKITTDDGAPVDLEMLLRRVIREEAGITPVAPAEKWRGGDVVLRPSKAGVQEKTIPIETFFHKVVMLRNRLRLLEQQINASEISEELKVKLQGYVTGCYGTLTTFNVLFADESDRFQGSGGD